MASPFGLPQGWTEHVSPTGQLYYYHSLTRVSTYTRPVDGHPPAHPTALSKPKAKKEKPVSKTSIPGTDGWLRVTTNRDNVFYFHPITKRSEWIAPKEIAAPIREMELQQRRAEQERKRDELRRKMEDLERRRKERQERKRKAKEGVLITEFVATPNGDTKRELPDSEESDEDEDEEAELAIMDSSLQEDQGAIERVGPQQAEEDDDNKDEDNDDDHDHGHDHDHDHDAEWQLQMAERMAAEAEVKDRAADAATTQEQDTTDDTPTRDTGTVPAAEHSLEELNSGFLLALSALNGTPKEINPMAPWDLELPKFSDLSAYAALPSQRAREEVFNEWCKLRIREKRASKTIAAAAEAAATKPSSADTWTLKGDVRPPSTSASSKNSAGAEDAYRALLREEVRSTRTKFEDFRSAFRRDRRFTGYGHDDRIREKLFKQHLFELGEEKRKAAEKAESEFLDLLSDKMPGNFRNKLAESKARIGDSGNEAVSTVWLEAKKTPGVMEDKRYDAVGSSTRRLELFKEWAKGERRPDRGARVASASSSTRRQEEAGATSHCDAAYDRARAKEDAKRQALREREEKVRREREKILRANRAALSCVQREENLVQFQQLLVDSIRDAWIRWPDAAARLVRDPRSDAPGLSDADKQRLFEEHVERLEGKQRLRLGEVFYRHAKSLDSHPEDVIVLTLEDPELSRGDLSYYRDNRGALEQEFERWNADRQAKAKEDFVQMLRESAFVEFWGRLKKSVAPETELDGSAGEHDDEEEQATLRDMARKVDLHDIQSILRNDARYRAFGHVPHQREEWIRQHLASLAAPKKSFVQ